MTASAPRSRPLVLSSLLAVVAGAAAVALVATAGAQTRALLVEVVGLVLLWAGIDGSRRGRPALGGLLALAGLGTVLLALGLGVAGTAAFSATAELVPGMLGLLGLALGVADVRDGWARPLVTGGAALLLVGVVTSGVVYGASALALLAATAASILAWDLGEQAINLSEHVGRRAQSRGVELVHGGAGAIVGAGTVVSAFVLRGVRVGTVPYAGLLALLGAAVVLTVALYN